MRISSCCPQASSDPLSHTDLLFVDNPTRYAQVYTTLFPQAIELEDEAALGEVSLRDKGFGVFWNFLE